MTESIIEICNGYISQILKDICRENNLDYQAMSEKYLPTSIIKTCDQSATPIVAEQKIESQSEPANEKEKTAPQESPKRATSSHKKKKQEYLEVVEFEHSGTKYYIDKKSNIYSFDIEKPKLLGIRLVDGSIKFY